MSDALADFVAARLAAHADLEKAAKMQAYLKTEMPFHGVSRSDQKPILREAKKRFRPEDRDAWRQGILALWTLEHREEKQLALDWGRAFPRYCVAAELPLFERLVREGAWWDLVDVAAVHLLGTAWMTEREEVGPAMDRWIADEDLWIRRSAIIGQLRHKGSTDTERLFAYCERCADERSFWIRKAIGWALRQHARTDAAAVRAFLERMGERLSGLSRREAAKHL